MVALKTTTLPHFGLSKPTGVVASPASEMADPLSADGVDLRPPQKTNSSGNVREHVKRSLSARGIIRSPSITATTALKQTHSEAAGKPRAASTVELGAKSRTGSLLSLSGLRGTPSPAPSVPANGTQTPIPSASEASYVSKASLRISEAVNHIFPSGQPAAVVAVTPIYKGRVPPSPDRARELAVLIVSEVKACLHDQYLLKTFLRSAIAKAMSILLSRIEGLMLLPTSEPTLLTVPANSRVAAPTPSQRFAFEVVRCAYEVGQGLEEAIDLAGAPAAVAEAFKPWIAKLDAVSSRTVGPLIAELKKELIARVAQLGAEESHATHPPYLRAISLGRSLPASTEQGSMAKLGDMLEVSRKLLQTVHCPLEEEKWAVGLATTVVWKGMLTIVSHNMASSSAQESETTTAPVAKRSTLTLHKSTGKRSPSPPHHAAGRLQQPQARFLHDAESLHGLIARFTESVGRLEPLNGVEKPKDACAGCQFCGGTILPDDLTSDSDSDSDDPRRLAQEALHEALLALASVAVVLRACASGPAGAVAVRAAQSGPCATLRRALDTCPPLILLHLLASQIPRERGLRLPHQVWGVSWAEYDGSLRGFASGEEWTAEVALEILREAQRVRKEEEAAGRPFSGVEADWLVALEEQAMADVRESG